MSKEIEEIKVCTGCDRFSDDPINDSYIGCCPDNNYVPLKDEFRVQQQKIKQLEKEVERLEEGCKKALERHQGGHSELGMYLRKLLTK